MAFNVGDLLFHREDGDMLREVLHIRDDGKYRIRILGNGVELTLNKRYVEFMYRLKRPFTMENE